MEEEEEAERKDRAVEGRKNAASVVGEGRQGKVS